MANSKKTPKAPVKAKEAPKPKSKAVRPNPKAVHLAGIPCMNGLSKPVVDVTYTYNRANVTCKQCLGAK